MKVVTVRQPWAWAIVHSGKLIENRTWLTHYRGPVAIHAGTTWSLRGLRSGLVWRALEAFGWTAGPAAAARQHLFRRGLIIGVAELVDAHWAEPGCCHSPWAEYEVYKQDERGPGRVSHFVLANRRPVDPPVPWRGSLNIRPLPDAVAAQVLAGAA